MEKKFKISKKLLNLKLHHLVYTNAYAGTYLLYKEEKEFLKYKFGTFKKKIVLFVVNKKLHLLLIR